MELEEYVLYAINHAVLVRKQQQIAQLAYLGIYFLLQTNV
jgi:hypothetical protein